MINNKNLVSSLNSLKMNLSSIHSANLIKREDNFDKTEFIDSKIDKCYEIISDILDIIEIRSNDII
jgi:hypothetical protein